MPTYQPSSVFGFAVNGLLVFTSVANMIYGHKFSYVLRISGGYLGIASLMVILPLATNALEAGNAFAVDISILTIFGVFGGIVQSSTFALGGMLPGKYMGAIMLGNGLSGISLNICRAITLAAIPDDYYMGALIYFILASLILIFCAFAHWKFQQLEFVKYYIKLANDEKNKTQRRISGVHGSALISEDAEINKSGNYLPTTDRGSQLLQVKEVKEISPLRAFFTMMFTAFKLSYTFLLSIVCVFFVTFVIFPAVICDTNIYFLHFIQSTDLRIGWTMLMFIFAFNLFDTIGRWLAGQSYGGLPDKVVLVMTYSRFIFIATTFLVDQNVGPAWLTGSDWFKLLNMALFAFTNGYCSTQCAIKAPSRAPEDSKEVVGIFIGISITSGIVMGSLLALFTKGLVHGNPK
ncbi:hypothetical protein FGO68_gene5917 [Halteria grandinella]|uniref:Equilibrative nucleoside transporter n=1 Tax=Halteria grandinella TaxID=5974 RepID=A0A8J8SWD1_HALGN|nr:hypothetical protein FGO68_gene5917 [Halteria grandinella]